MMNWVDAVNFAFAVCGLITAVQGLILSRSVPYLEHRTRLFTLAVYSLIIVYIASDLLSQVSLIFFGPGYRDLSSAAVFLESLFCSLLMPLLTVYLLHRAGESWLKRPEAWVVFTLWAVYFAMLVSTLFTSEFYTVTEENVYLRGPWYPVLLAPTILLMVINLAILILNRGKYSPRERKAFFAYLLIPLGCMMVQAMAYGLLMIVIGTSVGAMVMFNFILRDQMERYIGQQEENIRQRNSIMMLQMRPHFVYNTMTSIYYLCKQDPDKAQRVILDFTSYLRRNFTAIAKEENVPFSEEMEHTRAYLAVEEVRFEGALYVETDTPHTAFRLPPLTLQPIVENAVKHGMDPEMEPLHIRIRTRKTERGNEITVEDSGPGFQGDENDDPHVALDNIRERLKIMCGGTLEISPREGGGTTVTIVVP